MSWPSEEGIGYYFDSLYEQDSDPWGFSTRWYEQRRYALTLAALTKARYTNVFEPGCSIGVLSELLAPRCDRILAADISAKALAIASSRGLPDNIQLELRSVPEDWPEETFDLILLSEVCYYLDEESFRQVIDRSGNSLEEGGQLLVVNWRQPVEGSVMSGDQIHRVLQMDSGLIPLAAYIDTWFRLDLLGKGESAIIDPKL